MGLFVSALFFGAPALAQAQSVSSSITLTGVVPEMRVIYVNQDGYITEIVGNTDKNVTPSVADLNNNRQAMTSAISQQYAYFMDQHKWRLEPGTYKVNPVQINTEANAQQIVVESSASQISLNDVKLTVYN